MDDFKHISSVALVVSLKLKNILDHLAKKPLEWSAVGMVDEVKENGVIYYILTDIHFPEQENAGASTDVTAQQWTDLGYKLQKAGHDTSKMKVWIHSHNKMGAFWSGTDTAQMDDFAGANSTYRLSLVVTSNGPWKAAYNMFSPIRMDFDIGILFQDNVTEQSILDSYKADLESKEKERVYAPLTGGKAVMWDDKLKRMVPKDYDIRSGWEEYDDIYAGDIPPEQEGNGSLLDMFKGGSKKQRKKAAARLKEVVSTFTPREKTLFEYYIKDIGMKPAEAIQGVIEERELGFAPKVADDIQ